MRKTFLKSALAIGLAAVTLSAQAIDTNIALGKVVTTGGGSFGGISATWGSGGLAMPATVTDGAFVNNGQQWNTGTVFWYLSATNNPYIEIDLAGLFDVRRIVLQADNNDLYRVTYKDTGGTWQTLADIDPTTAGWGMATGDISFPTITASAFRIQDGPGGDCCDSVSEFQAYGVAAVPEPETYAMLLAGLGLLGFTARRRKSTAA